MTVCIKLSGKEACMHVIGVPLLVYAIEANANTACSRYNKRLLVSLYLIIPLLTMHILCALSSIVSMYIRLLYYFKLPTGLSRSLGNTQFSSPVLEW